MAVRKKTALEKFFSLNQHRKKWGAKKLQGELPDYEVLKATVLEHGEPCVVIKATKSLEAHIENLKIEFSGKSELLHYHAKLIVLIRREVSVASNYKLFRELWDSEAEFLLKNLDIRWLTSAADTLTDHDADIQVSHVAMMAVLLVNTVKLYETEKAIYARRSDVPDTTEAVASLSSHEPLFDGLRCFAVGRDDTLRNMYWRIQSFGKVKPSGQILIEIYDRLQINDTAFSRFQNLGPIQRTVWWK